MDFMRRRNAWLILSILLSIFFWNSHSSGLAETSVVAEPFYVQTITWEENENASSVKLSIKNQSNSTITDPAVCVCFQDASETIVETSVIQQHGRLRNEQAMIFSASISMSSNPVSAYVDYIQYKDELGETKTYYFIEPLVASRITDSEKESSPVPSEVAVASETTETGKPQQEETTPKQISNLDEDAPRIEFGEAFLELVKGKTANLKPSVLNSDEKKVKYTWESSNSGVAVVSPEGKVKAVDGGETTVVCRTVLSDGIELSASVTVKVTVPVESLRLAETKEITLKAGTSKLLSYTITPENATDQTLEWTSNDPEIVSVDTEGVVTAMSAGRAKITGKTRDGSNKRVSISIYVPSLECPVSYVKMDKEDKVTVHLNYYGNNWDENIIIKTEGSCFSYSIDRSGVDVSIVLYSESVGSGTISIQEKNDFDSRVKILVQVDASALPFYKYVKFKTPTTAGGRKQVIATNNTEYRVVQFRAEIKTYDAAGRLLREKDCYCAGYVLGTLEFESSVRPKESKEIFKWFDDLQKCDYYEVALKEVWTTEYKFYCVNDNDLVWYSSKTGAYIDQTDQSQEIHSYEFGIDLLGCDLPGSYSIYNPFVQNGIKYTKSGMTIDNLEKGGLFDRAGFMEGDNIYAIDGNDDEWYSILQANGRLKAGESVVISIERPGVGLLDYKLTKEGSTLISMKPFSEDKGFESDNLTSDGSSILNHSTIKRLIISCPSIGKSTKPTKEFYASLSEYNRDFPTGKHSWRISIQNGAASFADENQMTVLLYKPKGTVSEIVSVLDWWIKILDALPSVQTFAEQNGISLVAEKRGGEDYAAYADANGVIDLTNQTKREKVLEIMHDNKGILDTLDAIGQGLGSLDTNGNGEIDPYEIFDYGDEQDWYVSNDGKFAIKPSYFRKAGSRYLFTLQVRNELTKETSDQVDLEFSADEDNITLKEGDAIQDFIYKGNGKYSFTLNCDCRVGSINLSVTQEYTMTVK